MFCWPCIVSVSRPLGSRAQGRRRAWAPEAAAITVPVFAGTSEHDIVGLAPLSGGSFPGIPDFMAFILPGATREICAGPHTALLYDRLAQWFPSALMARPPLAPRQ